MAEEDDLLKSIRKSWNINVSGRKRCGNGTKKRMITSWRKLISLRLVYRVGSAALSILIKVSSKNQIAFDFSNRRLHHQIQSEMKIPARKVGCNCDYLNLHSILINYSLFCCASCPHSRPPAARRRLV